MGKLRAFLLIVLGVFLASAGPVFLANLASDAMGNVWRIPLSTWQTIASAGIAGLVTYGLAVLAPVAIKPSASLKLPEA